MQFSLLKFPPNPDIKEVSGIPWGCSIQPFCNIQQFQKKKQATTKTTVVEEDPNNNNSDNNNNNNTNTDLPFPQILVNSNEVARCESCFGYINPYVTFQRTQWKCSLCYHSNYIPSTSRYATLVARPQLPELRDNLIEYRVTTTSSSNIQQQKNEIKESGNSPLKYVIQGRWGLVFILLCTKIMDDSNYSFQTIIIIIDIVYYYYYYY